MNATNATQLLSDNVSNARDVIVPLAIGILVLVVGIVTAKRFWNQLFNSAGSGGYDEKRYSSRADYDDERARDKANNEWRRRNG